MTIPKKHGNGQNQSDRQSSSTALRRQISEVLLHVRIQLVVVVHPILELYVDGELSCLCHHHGET